MRKMAEALPSAETLRHSLNACQQTRSSQVRIATVWKRSVTPACTPPAAAE
ncbi:MAG: hypothetical protein NTV33_09620 [Coprothermobacterota bacterium]|nr:hypothetical protein [Coprothermobacterota bacterium]